jgi:hypothetical protein
MGATDDGTPVAVGDGHGEFRSQETVRRDARSGGHA